MIAFHEILMFSARPLFEEIFCFSKPCVSPRRQTTFGSTGPLWLAHAGAGRAWEGARGSSFPAGPSWRLLHALGFDPATPRIQEKASTSMTGSKFLTMDDATRQDTTRRAMGCDAMRCDAMRCGALRCDAMRGNAMRCGSMRCDAMRCDAI